MRCPFDESPLQVVNRSGVEIDWCPSCKGVWLERGELDKLIDLAQPTASVGRVHAAPVQPMGRDAGTGDSNRRDRWTDQPPVDHDRDDLRRRWGSDDDGDGDWEEHRSRGDGRRRKRSSLLSEIFDF